MLLKGCYARKRTQTARFLADPAQCLLGNDAGMRAGLPPLPRRGAGARSPGRVDFRGGGPVAGPDRAIRGSPAATDFDRRRPADAGRSVPADRRGAGARGGRFDHAGRHGSADGSYAARSCSARGGGPGAEPGWVGRRPPRRHSGRSGHVRAYDGGDSMGRETEYAAAGKHAGGGRDGR